MAQEGSEAELTIGFLGRESLALLNCVARFPLFPPPSSPTSTSSAGLPPPNPGVLVELRWGRCPRLSWYIHEAPSSSSTTTSSYSEDHFHFHLLAARDLDPACVTGKVFQKAAYFKQLQWSPPPLPPLANPTNFMKVVLAYPFPNPLTGTEGDHKVVVMALQDVSSSAGVLAYVEATADYAVEVRATSPPSPTAGDQSPPPAGVLLYPHLVKEGEVERVPLGPPFSPLKAVVSFLADELTEDSAAFGHNLERLSQAAVALQRRSGCQSLSPTTDTVRQLRRKVPKVLQASPVWVPKLPHSSWKPAAVTWAPPSDSHRTPVGREYVPKVLRSPWKPPKCAEAAWVPEQKPKWKPRPPSWDPTSYHLGTSTPTPTAAPPAV